MGPRHQALFYQMSGYGPFYFDISQYEYVCIYCMINQVCVKRATQSVVLSGGFLEIKRTRHRPPPCPV